MGRSISGCNRILQMNLGMRSLHLSCKYVSNCGLKGKSSKMPYPLHSIKLISKFPTPEEEGSTTSTWMKSRRISKRVLTSHWDIVVVWGCLTSIPLRVVTPPGRARTWLVWAVSTSSSGECSTIDPTRFGRPGEGGILWLSQISTLEGTSNIGKRTFRVSKQAASRWDKPMVRSPPMRGSRMNRSYWGLQCGATVPDYLSRQQGHSPHA
ncbi:hypothetical protein AVEN_10342-1 [Araneus ventricosus]|uniref:Uncharacterized protein n=1 Tax=Araneus ventricosus TaxID=182803 RepID=A0A4Y2UTX2_ARAVE|nr:hypothetical protein AVEN_10342-1 [Araneus ventricosus]